MKGKMKVQDHSLFPDDKTDFEIMQEEQEKKRAENLLLATTRSTWGLDTGETVGKTATAVREGDDLNDDSSIYYETFDNPIKGLEYIVKRMPSPDEKETLVVTEDSACNFDPVMRTDFQQIARAARINLRPIDPRHTKNRRKTWYPDDPKTDEGDAKVLLRIGEEGIIPRKKWGPFKNLSFDPVARLRQLHYTVDHEKIAEIVLYLPEMVNKIVRELAPQCAIKCGAAEAHTKGVRWLRGPMFYTPIVVSLVLVQAVKDKFVPQVCLDNNNSLFQLAARKLSLHSNRAIKEAFKLRGTAKSNFLFHRLRGIDDRDTRKTIMDIQNEWKRWIYHFVCDNY